MKGILKEVHNISLAKLFNMLHGGGSVRPRWWFWQATEATEAHTNMYMHAHVTVFPRLKGWCAGLDALHAGSGDHRCACETVDTLMLLARYVAIFEWMGPGAPP